MSDVDRTCEYVLDPDDPETWDGEETQIYNCCLSEEDTNKNGVWSCPHQADKNSNLCIFHKPAEDKDVSEILKELENIITNESNKYQSDDHRTQFIGSRLPKLDFDAILSNKTIINSISDSDYLDFRHSIFRGDIRGDEVRLEASLLFDGVYCEGMVSFGNATITDKISLRWSTVKDGIDFRQSYIGGKLDLRYSDINSGVALVDAYVESDANFSLSSIGGDLNFNRADFEYNLGFYRTKINGEADFSRITVNELASFCESDMTDVSFLNATIRAGDLRKTDFTGADFSGATLRNANLERAVLSRADLFGTDLRGAAFYGALLADAQINEETEFGARCVYDPENETSSRDWSELYLDRFTDAPVADMEDTKTRRVTKAAGQYRIIEQLARTNAFPDMVGHNFIRRQDIRREQHRQEGRWGRWLRATASKYVLEYGENPWRLIATGLIIVVGFGLLYPLVGGLQPTGGSPITASRVIENPLLLAQSIYYSTLTFTTLGMGDFLPVGLGRVLTTLETSLGAIIIALLVFVFGRRAAR